MSAFSRSSERDRKQRCIDRLSEYCKVAFKLKVLGRLTHINKAVFCSLVIKTTTTLREKGGKEKQGTVKKTRECRKRKGKERKAKGFFTCCLATNLFNKKRLH